MDSVSSLSLVTSVLFTSSPSFFSLCFFLRRRLLSCLSKCFWRYPFDLNSFGHKWQMYSLPPSLLWWSSKCIWYRRLNENVLPQTSHFHGFSFWWIVSCSARYDLSRKLLLHTFQEIMNIKEFYLNQIK